MVGLAYNSDNLRCICNAYLVTFIIRYILTIRQMSDKFQLCAQPRVCSLTGENPVYPRPNQPDISESWDGISNGA